MTRYAHNYSRIAAALLALTAACGSGRPAPVSKFGVRVQNPAELDTETEFFAAELERAGATLVRLEEEAGSGEEKVQGYRASCFLYNEAPPGAGMPWIDDR